MWAPDLLASPGLLAALAALCAAVYLARRRPLNERGLPLIGSMLPFIRNPRTFVVERYRKYGQGFTVNLFLQDTAVFLGQEAEKALAKLDNKALAVHWPYHIRTLLGPRSISVALPAENARLRKLVAGTMGPKQLGAYAPELARLAFDCCEAWSAREGPFSFMEESARYAMDVATTFLFDQRFPPDRRDWLVGTFATWLGGFATLLPVEVPGTVFGKGMAARRELIAFFGECLADIRGGGGATAAAAARESGHRSALSRLMEARDDAGDVLDDATLKDTMLTLIFAGHDTTAHTMSSLLWHLREHPDILARLRAELDTRWDGRPESLTYDLLMSDALPVLDAVVKETLRLTPAVVQSPRQVISDAEVAGVRLCAGDGAIFSHVGTHTVEDPSAPGLEAPEAFQPDRFLGAEPLDKANPYAFVPFGAGPRMCLGYQLARLEVKAFVAVLARHWEWEVPDGSLSPFPIYAWMVTMTPPRKRGSA